MADTTTYNKTNSGTDLSNLLTTLFVGLKITGHIDWSWFWVISPTVINIVTVMFCVFVITFVKELTKKFK